MTVSCFFETFSTGRLRGWLENLILMRTQLSAMTWTWTLDFELGFVKMPPVYPIVPAEFELDLVESVS